MLVKRNENGFGLMYGVRFDEEPPVGGVIWFDSAAEVANDLSVRQTLVLGGEPGAGKSHITSDVLKTFYNQGVGSCLVSCHINVGSRKGRAQTSEVLGTAAELGPNCLVILDNLDFTIYTGDVGRKRRRANSQVRDYLGFMYESLSKCVVAGNRVLATVHTDEWRANHSKMPEREMSDYHGLIEILGGEVEFRGLISAGNAERIMSYREFDNAMSREISQELGAMGALNFRNAYHINPKTYLDSGVGAAVTEVEARKDLKLAGGA